MKFLMIAVSIILLAPLGSAQAPPAISGDYVEARSAEVYTCGCLYSGEMVTEGRQAILIWRITSGGYEGAALAGIKVAAVVVGETNLGVVGMPRRAALYLDGIASEAQREAILALWSREYGQALGEVRSARTVPIRFERQSETVSIEIPGAVRLQVRKALLPEDAHPGSSLWYGPFAPLSDSTLATALDFGYWGVDFQRQWHVPEPSISGYVGRFVLTPGR